ncbi:hypothetical protein SISSUDRAFT_1041676 [Sistotremastrum suecicum HHB10207 ss-3]|uniref:F-box domain-containing protein n=1 Tax=Sistotremastrum suecicum HHB10207 ss-3 TaxID=1314776 RepID=A0A166H5M6_9AGAM|nr:hypothetical protein SISSUDRAFT_1041676 [Sistotremastrum suecicum HHB10207 ss-3]
MSSLLPELFVEIATYLIEGYLSSYATREKTYSSSCGLHWSEQRPGFWIDESPPPHFRPYAQEGFKAMRLVCRRWNEYLISDPRFWSNLSLIDRDDLPIFRIAMERSSHLPISLSLGELSGVKARHQWNTQTSQVLSGILATHHALNRCYRLSLDMRTSDVAQLCESTRWRQIEMPSLRTLALNTLSFERDAQAERQFELDEDNAVIFPEPLEALEVQDIIATQSRPELPPLFNSMSALETLVLSTRQPPNWENLVFFPHELKSLKIFIEDWPSDPVFLQMLSGLHSLQYCDIRGNLRGIGPWNLAWQGFALDADKILGGLSHNRLLRLHVALPSSNVQFPLASALPPLHITHLYLHFNHLENSTDEFLSFLELLVEVEILHISFVVALPHLPLHLTKRSYGLSKVRMMTLECSDHHESFFCFHLLASFNFESLGQLTLGQWQRWPSHFGIHQSHSIEHARLIALKNLISSIFICPMLETLYIAVGIPSELIIQLIQRFPNLKKLTFAHGWPFEDAISLMSAMSNPCVSDGRILAPYLENFDPGVEGPSTSRQPVDINRFRSVADALILARNIHTDSSDSTSFAIRSHLLM